LKEIIINKKRFLIHFLIWTAIIFIISVQLYSAKGNIHSQFIYRISINIIIFYINYSLLVPLLLLKKKKILYLISVVVLILTTYIIVSTFFQKPNFAPDFVRKRPVIIPFTIMYIIIGVTIRMYEEWVMNDRNKKEIEAQKNLSELETLKNQLNPHFLFNSLNSIYSLTVKKSIDAPEAVITLSELMRYMLYKANDDFVLLKQELEYIENYIKLQRLRIANNENVKINIHGIISTQKIRPLLFISYIENAFKYGTDFKGNTEIKIDISVIGNELQFICTNLIGNINKDNENSGIGMQNTRERLQLLYPEKHWLTINGEGNKFIVDLKLNLG
jgi:sensor histidine kinase YesM